MDEANLSYDQDVWGEHSSNEETETRETSSVYKFGKWFPDFSILKLVSKQY